MAGTPVASLPGAGDDRERELQRTLRGRLVVAAGLFTGFYGVLGLINIPAVRAPDAAPAAVRLMLGVAVWRGRSWPVRRQRWAEAAIFVLGAGFLAVANFFTVAQHGLLALPEGRAGHPFFTTSGIRLDPLTLRWFAVITGYGLVIPNNWRRTASVTGVMAFVYLGSLVGQALVQGAAAGHIIAALTYPAVWMAIAWVAAGFGAYRVGVLQQQVYDARKLGQYRLQQRLGSGGMGEVWLAEHVLLRQPRAVKVVRPEQAGHPDALARFEREVMATARLRHRNTVEIYDYGRASDGTFYYVMEYLDGLDLDELVKRHGALPPGRAIHLLRQVCAALAEAHAQGLVHRDLKPGNVVVCPGEGPHDLVKLLDFGLVKDVRREEVEARLTQEGALTGTPAFMAPEQIQGAALDARSDVYGLGCLAYLLLTGRPPFGDRPLFAAIAAHLHELPVAPSQARVSVSPELDDVVLRCLAKQAEERFPDMASVDRALAACPEAGSWRDADAAAWWARHGRRTRRSGEVRVVEP